jgi:microcystin-dependent protein
VGTGVVIDAGTEYCFSTGATAGQTVTHTHNVDIPLFSGNSGSYGTDGSHNNMQPYLVVNYIIKF